MMASVVNFENTLGAGQRLKSDLASAAQGREFNSLKMSGERQRQDLQERIFSAEEQRANTEKFLTGFEIMKTNPNIIPRVLEEFAGSGMIEQEAIPAMIAESQSNPQLFQQKMDDFAAELRFSLGQGPTAREDRKILQGADKLNRFVDTGEQVFEGVEAPTGGSLVGTAESFFNSLTEDLTPEQQAQAREIQLGLQARAGTISGLERRSTDADLGDAVIEQLVSEAEATEFAKKTGVSRARTIDEGVASIQKIDVNNRNLGKAIAAIDEGAQTGPIISQFTPTVRAATVKLEQVQKLLGLDVIGAVTFGALSKGELDLALETALPTNLQAPELRQWLLDKQAANKKLRDYFSAQIEFVDTGGTLAGFLRQQGRQAEGNVIEFADLPQ